LNQWPRLTRAAAGGRLVQSLRPDATMPSAALTRPLNAATTALLAGLIAAATALAGPGDARAAEPIGANYLCKGTFDATEVRALFFNNPPSEVILLTGTEGASRLLQQRSGSGARYADGDEVFWIKGDRASWQRGKARALDCEVRPTPAR